MWLTTNKTHDWVLYLLHLSQVGKLWTRLFCKLKGEVSIHRMHFLLPTELSFTFYYLSPRFRKSALWKGSCRIFLCLLSLTSVQKSDFLEIFADFWTAALAGEIKPPLRLLLVIQWRELSASVNEDMKCLHPKGIFFFSSGNEWNACVDLVVIADCQKDFTTPVRSLGTVKYKFNTPPNELSKVKCFLFFF